MDWTVSCDQLLLNLMDDEKVGDGFGRFPAKDGMNTALINVRTISIKGLFFFLEERHFGEYEKKKREKK